MKLELSEFELNTTKNVLERIIEAFKGNKKAEFTASMLEISKDVIQKILDNCFNK